MSDEYFVWLDVETFGLNPRVDPIIEVGFCVTNLDLEIIDGVNQILIWDADCDKRHKQLSARVDEDESAAWVLKQHRKSGLWDEARELGAGRKYSEEFLCDTLRDEYRGLPMAGSSVQFDRNMLTNWMPKFAGLFHYRNIDISTVKELCKRWNPGVYQKLDQYTGKQEKHRVEPDLQDTLGEARYYAENFLSLAY